MEGKRPVVWSFDVGSLPFAGDLRRFMEGAASYVQVSSRPNPSDPVNYFEGNVVESFLDKVRMGIDVPNYPQFRDMNEMLLKVIDNAEKGKEGYVESGLLAVRTERAEMPEVAAIKDNSKEIREKIGQPLQLKICVTGPYTLSCLFVHRDGGIFNRLGKIISQIVEKNIFNGKHGGVKLVAVDEPTFGLLDDPLIDYGAEGREYLRSAWELILHRAASRGAHTCLHLHETTDDLFWQVNSLKVVESHVDDLLYQSRETKKNLESTDKFLKASICISDFDKLIRENVAASLPQKTGELSINEKVAEAWKDIVRRKLDPTIFLESRGLMQQRLTEIINRFGVERVPFAGPECGLKSFPTYGCAMECLKRAANTVKNAVSQR